ncbi:hypothetical protein RIF29_27441 [Crotalaria pallida]|uniref:Pectinesterase inhibitor domain-containing protein n=1 Tax=Crotalaria pallida TaxID=3830 RepID=A0AAN9EP27_CROPI
MHVSTLRIFSSLLMLCVDLINGGLGINRTLCTGPDADEEGRNFELISLHALVNHDMIESVCNEVQDNVGFGEECLQLLSMDSRFNSASDYHDLSISILRFALAKGIQGQNYFIDIEKTNASQAIHQCATIYYNSTISFFRGALRDLDVNRDNANKEAGQAADGVESCKIAIDAEKIHNSTIINMNKMMSLLSDVAFSAIDLYSQE